MYKRLLIAACLLATAASPLPPKIVVGIYPSYPPLDVKDPATGAMSGFDVELGQVLAKRMGTSFDLQETNFAQFVSSVQTGRINLFLNGMNDTVARRELISFVDYLRSGTQFMVLASSAASYPTMQALCGKKIAGSRGTTFPAAVESWSHAHCEAEGKPAMVFMGADNTIDARSQMKQGRVDAIVQDSLTIPFVQSREEGVFQTIGEPFDITVMGIGITKEDQNLQAALQSALQAMIDDGSYAGLLKKWNLPASSAIPRATINAGS
jgi:polar amino acid transport system substrate-binding protein